MSKKELIKQLRQSFDDYANTVDGVEVWFARDLQKLLGYERWETFQRVITRAEIACEESGNDPADHFTVVSKPVEAGKGDQALFTYSTSAMKRKLGVPKNRPLADFLPRVTIAGKAFATEITNSNIEDKNLVGESEITQEHVQRNKDVRDVLHKAKIRPEKLPPADSRNVY